MPFAYDEVPYDTSAHEDTHPVAMATLARLAGLEPAPAANARVLEIGCSDGENLLAAATYLPNARFVGFDLAPAAIAAGKAALAPNVELFVGDILAVKDLGTFDYVIAHGLYSWVPEAVRAALLSLIRASLAPNGVGFLSANALPAWGYRGALRELALDRARGTNEPSERVAIALTVLDEVARDGKDVPGYLGRLAAAAAEYRAVIDRVTPPEAPFSRFLFHDLLAEHSSPFTFEDLSARLNAAGLCVVTEAPLALQPRAEIPFMQLLVQRDDTARAQPIDAARVRDLYLWADFTPSGPGAFRTTTGAVVRPEPGSGLARATAFAPGFVRVADLVGEDEALCAQLLAGFREGVFTLRSEPPPLGPTFAPHVTARARRGCAVMTNAIQRSFRLGADDLRAIAAGEPTERLRRHLFTGPT